MESKDKNGGIRQAAWYPIAEYKAAKKYNKNKPAI
jgi:hypothetical protein